MNPFRKSNWRQSPHRYSIRKNSTLTHAGEIVQRIFPRTHQTEQESGEAASFTFGNVLSRIWRNTRRDGTVYFRISLNRIDAQYGDETLRNNFRPADLNDVIRAARRCQIWFSELQK